MWPSIPGGQKHNFRVFFLSSFSFLGFHSRVVPEIDLFERLMWKLEKSGRSKINWMTRIRSYHDFEGKWQKRTVRRAPISPATLTDRYIGSPQHLHFARIQYRQWNIVSQNKIHGFKCEIYEFFIRLIFQYGIFQFFFSSIQPFLFTKDLAWWTKKKDPVQIHLDEKMEEKQQPKMMRQRTLLKETNKISLFILFEFNLIREQIACEKGLNLVLFFYLI